MPSYKLNVTLRGQKPAVSRWVSVPKNISFYDLNDIIVHTMGWSGRCTHEFRVRRNNTVIGPIDGSEVPGTMDEVYTRLSDFEYCDIGYIYDFGCHWEHSIRFLKDTDADAPRVIKYSGDCPPEDCGGIRGYNEMMEKTGSGKAGAGPMEQYAGMHTGYDMESVNDYLRGVWRPVDPSSTIDYATLYRIADVFCQTRDAYLDTKTMAVRYGKAGRNRLPIAVDDGAVLYGIADEFISSHKDYEARLENMPYPEKFGELQSLLRKDGNEPQWRGFLYRRTETLAEEWARDNGFTPLTAPKGADSFLRPLDKQLSDPRTAKMTFDTIRFVAGAIRDAGDLRGTDIMCPECGTSCKAKIDTHGKTVKIKGVDAFPILIKCPECRKVTYLDKLNDGYVIGYHYRGHTRPYSLEAPVLGEIISAGEAADADSRVCRLATAAVRQWFLGAGVIQDKAVELIDSGEKPGKWSTVADVLHGLMHTAVDIPNASSADKLGGLFGALWNAMRSMESGNSKDAEKYMKRTENMIAGCDPFLSLQIRSLALRGVCRHRENEATARRCVDLLTDARDVLTGAGGDEQIQIVFGQIYDGVSRYVHYYGSDETVRKVMDIGRSVVSLDERTVSYGLRSVVLYRLGLYELTTSEDPGKAAEYFGEIMDINMDMKDNGPLTNCRLTVAALVLYRGKSIGDKELDNVLEMAYQMAKANIVRQEDYIYYIMEVFISLIDIKGQDKAAKYLDKFIPQELLPAGAENQEFDPDELWDLDIQNLI